MAAAPEGDAVQRPGEEVTKEVSYPCCRVPCAEVFLNRFLKGYADCGQLGYCFEIKCSLYFYYLHFCSDEVGDFFVCLTSASYMRSVMPLRHS